MNRPSQRQQPSQPSQSTEGSVHHEAKAFPLDGHRASADDTLGELFANRHSLLAGALYCAMNYENADLQGDGSTRNTRGMEFNGRLKTEPRVSK